MSISNDIQIRAIGILKSYRSEQVSPSTSHSLPVNAPLPHADDSLSHSANLDLSVDVSDFVRWLDNRVTVKGLGESTARCYRKWVSAHLESLGHTSTAELREWIPPNKRARIAAAAEVDPDNVLQNDVDDSKLFVSSTSTNQRYLSFISESVLELVKADLMPPARTKHEDENPSRNRIASTETAMWFMCTLWTGLRPREWPYARYLEEHFDPDTALTQKQVLEVRTLKQAGRREDNPLKEKRYLVLENWPDNQIAALKMFLEMVYKHEDAGEFDSFYERRRKLLQRSWRRIVKAHSADIEHIGVELSVENKAKLKAIAKTTSSPVVFDGNALTFYTARHAFAEEARRSGQFSRFEIAAVLGHSMITNQSYYGPRKESLDREHSFTLPKAWPGDADAIEMWDNTANPLRGKFMNREDLSQSILDVESRNRERDTKDGVAGFFQGQ
ncbi:hypothetical protein [Pseudomonas sp. UMAB-40]|uniref:hypothetical protein n=1 Tax=Pseudomonas sp. UMAB-40 TaxID=1365407 RepID=UPI001C586EF6|nr:hypothetical protein [Pseudomonas sp. UMAB-40]